MDTNRLPGGGKGGWPGGGEGLGCRGQVGELLCVVLGGGEVAGGVGQRRGGGPGPRTRWEPGAGLKGGVEYVRSCFGLGVSE